MSLTTAILWIVSFWLLVYVAKYTPGRPKFLLPFAHNRRRATELTVRHLNIRLKTEAFNIFHDTLSAWLSSGSILRQVLLKSYDLGSFLGVIGMLLAFGLLIFTASSLSSDILNAGYVEVANTITRRGFDQDTDVIPPIVSESKLPRISLIIPGLTVPLNHLPLILVALTISQIVHEFGHAITAALHRIPMVSCGIAITFVFPSAFVTLPAARLEKLPPRDRLQIVSGGCFHNVVLFCLLFFAAWSRVVFFPSWILFQDISGQGRLVVDVDYDSPLVTHLPAGTLITKIDDSPMASVSAHDPWDNYLLSPSSGSVQGWCADNSLLDKALAPACPNMNGSYSCFVDEIAQYELDPVHIFTGNLQRCSSSAECTSGSCIAPRRDQQLVRISITGNHVSASIEDVIIWKGPKEEIWEQVHVGTLRPRLPLISLKLPEFASHFFQYMKLANLSLYLVNMLPITALDGYQLLVALLQFFCDRASTDLQSIDLEALNSATRSGREGRVQRTCLKLLNHLAVALVSLCALLGTVSWAMK